MARTRPKPNPSAIEQAPAAAADPTPAPTSMGPVIRAARRDAGMTLQQVAIAAELSISFLSQVERNQLTPSVSALKRIADVLRIPAGMLMFGLDNRSPAAAVGLVRRDGRKRVLFPQSHIAYEMLTPDLNRRMSVFWLDAPPHSESGPAFSHDGEDAVIVLKGRLRVETGGVWHDLGKGDSLYFNSEVPHRWANETAQVAQVIWISTPPSF